MSGDGGPRGSLRAGADSPPQRRREVVQFMWVGVDLLRVCVCVPLPSPDNKEKRKVRSVTLLVWGREAAECRCAVRCLEQRKEGERYYEVGASSEEAPVGAVLRDSDEGVSIGWYGVDVLGQVVFVADPGPGVPASAPGVFRLRLPLDLGPT